MAESQRSAWEQIRNSYFPRGNVDQMLALRHQLYDEIHAAQAARKEPFVGFINESDILRARALAASLFILMLEKKKAAEMLHPYVDGEQYPKEVLVNKDAFVELENRPRTNVLDTVAVCSIMTQTASLCYRSFVHDDETGLYLTQKAEAIFASHEKPAKKEFREVYLPFLLARHENLLHLSLFQWMGGGEQMSKARDSLQKSLNTLTIEYEKCLARPEHEAFAGSIEVLLTQTLGSLAERLWVEEPGTGWARARIYRSLQTIPMPAGGNGAQQIPGRSVDTCRRGYAYILASRIEADDTTTGYRLSIALAKDAERCFKELAETLGETHAWMVRARIQRLRCYIQAGKDKPAEPLYKELVKNVEKIKNKDPEEYDFAKGSLALTRTWMLERKAEAAPQNQREELWRECLAEAEQIIQSERIPGRLERDGLLHQGRALLNLAICLRRKGGDEEIRRSSYEYENQGRQFIQKAIDQARDRHRSKIVAAGYVFLAEGLRETDPGAAAAALHDVDQLPGHAKTTYIQGRLDKLYTETPIVKDGFVTLSLDMDFKKVLAPALQAAYLDYHSRETAKNPGSPQGAVSKLVKKMPWSERHTKRLLNQIEERRRGIPIESKPRKADVRRATPQGHEGEGVGEEHERKERA